MFEKMRNRLCLVALVTLGAILGTGCSVGSKDPAPFQDTNSSLRDLAVTDANGGALPFSSTLATIYALSVTTDVPTITVQATAMSPKSELTLNGTTQLNGTLTMSVPISVGLNVLNLAVKAENGSVTTYVLQVTKVLEGNSALAGLGVSAGVLSPAFSTNTHAYTLALFSPLPSLTVTPATASTKALVRVNTALVTSGQPSGAIALVAGTPKVITVQVEAQDHTSTTYTLTVTENVVNTTVWVLDGTNGSPVAGTVLQITDPAGIQLQGNIAVDATGQAALGLPPTAKYNLFAKAPGSAQASLVNFDPTLETVASLYCHPLGMTTYPAIAPQITALSYSTDGVKWVPVVNNTITDTWANIAAIRVTAVAQCGISPTAWSGFGIGMNVDASANGYGRFTPYETTENSVPVTINGLPYYQTTSSFGLPVVSATAGDKHTVDLVIYDVANNRTEQKVYLTITDTTASIATDKDLSTYTPTSMIVQMTTYGLTRDVFSMTGNITYQPIIQFNVGTSTATAPGLRGFEVWRATDATTFRLVRTVQFGALSTGTSGVYSTYDVDPAMDTATTYTYKVRGFAANTSTATSAFTQFSPAVSAKLMPAFTATLAAPAENAISMTRTPVFAFVNSNPALFDPAVSDSFRFFLFIKDKNGTAVYSQAYRYNWLYLPAGATVPVPRFEKKNGALTTYIDATSEVTISADKGTISIQLPLTSVALVPGVPYEWTIFGTLGSTSYSTSNAASFFKAYTNPAGTAGQAVSYGSTYEKSYGAINGYYTLIIDPAAK